MPQRKTKKNIKEDKSSDELIIMGTESNNSGLKSICSNLEDDCVIVKEDSKLPSSKEKNVDSKQDSVKSTDRNQNLLNNILLSVQNQAKRIASLKSDQTQGNKELSLRTLTDVNKPVNTKNNITVNDIKSKDTKNGITVNDIKSKDTKNGITVNDIKSKDTKNGAKTNPVKTKNGAKTNTVETQNVIKTNTVNNGAKTNTVNNVIKTNTVNNVIKTNTVNNVIKTNTVETQTKTNTVIDDTMVSETDNLPTNSIKSDAKYTIKFKSGDFEKTFYLNDDDPIEIIYKELFGSDTEKKLLYEDMKLSRFLLASESGFFPGINYIYLPEGESFVLSTKTITVKINENIEDDIKITIERLTKAQDILSTLKASSNTNFVLVFNGDVLEESSLLDSIVENGVVLDVIDKKLIK